MLKSNDKQMDPKGGEPIAFKAPCLTYPEGIIPCLLSQRGKPQKLVTELNVRIPESHIESGSWAA